MPAVTGAGKTEMMFQGIQYARIQGDNIAIVSPRVDVVVEISKRIKDAFLNEDIDILHQQSRQQFEGHFVLYAQCINFTDSNSTLILFLLMKSMPFLYQWIKIYNKH